MAVVRVEEMKTILPLQAEVAEAGFEKAEVLERAERTVGRRNVQSGESGCLYKQIPVSAEHTKEIEVKVKISSGKGRLFLSESLEAEELFEEVGRELGMNFWRNKRVQQGGKLTYDEERDGDAYS